MSAAPSSAPDCHKPPTTNDAHRPNAVSWRTDAGVVVLLVGATITAFGPAISARFLNFDDNLYVVENSHVNSGLSAENVRWAFSAFHAGNWHPLTWLSLQLDATLWRGGGKPDSRGFHLTNVLLHAASAAALYVVLVSLSGNRWRSAAVTALFALHPLRVESVAWVSERKDVLSVFLGILTIQAYALYCRRRNFTRYLAVFACFALSLLAKPGLVTLPGLLLVIDWWPLGLLTTAARWRARVLEKLPLLALSVACSVVTFEAQRLGGAVSGLRSLSFAQRVSNAVVAYATYLQKTILPLWLSPHYPLQPNGWPFERVVASAAVLIACTGVALWNRGKRPYLLAGWLWYLGSLVPVIGFVQVGTQAFADRYTYFPCIGLWVAVVWAAGDLAAPGRVSAIAAVVVAAVLAVFFGALTWRQSGFWRDDQSLWTHSLEVTGPDALAYNQLGTAIEARDGGFDEAIRYYRLGAETLPTYGTCECNFARALRATGKKDAAAEHFRRALQLDSRSPTAHNDLGGILYEDGAKSAAEEEFRRALECDPGCVAAHRNMARVLEDAGRGDEAMRHSLEAVRCGPEDCGAHRALGVRLYKRRDYAGALDHLRRAAEIQPDDAGIQSELGIVLQCLGRLADAADCFHQAVQLDPNDVHTRLRLASALAASGEAAGAQEQYFHARRLDPRWPELLAREAWKLSTAPESTERDGETAVWSAEMACAAVQPPPPQFLDVLGTSYAEIGRFPEAIAAAEKAITSAETANKSELAKQVAARLTLYRQRKPFHRMATARG